MYQTIKLPTHLSMTNSEEHVAEILNRQESKGWTYINSIVITETDIPGCLASFLGHRPQTTAYTLLVFMNEKKLPLRQRIADQVILTKDTTTRTYDKTGG